MAATSDAEKSAVGFVATIKEWFGKVWHYISHTSTVLNMKDPKQFVTSWAGVPITVGRAPLICMKSRYKGGILTTGDVFTVERLESKNKYTKILVGADDVLPDDVVVITSPQFKEPMLSFVGHVFSAIAYSSTFTKIPLEQIRDRMASLADMNKFLSSKIGTKLVVDRVPLLIYAGRNQYVLHNGDTVSLVNYGGSKQIDDKQVDVWELSVAGDSYEGTAYASTDNIYRTYKNLRESRYDQPTGLSRVVGLYERISR